MTTLVVEDMYTILEQDFTVNHNRRYLIEGIKIYLMMYNSPAGTFTLSVKQSAATIASKSFTSADIKTDLSTSNNYAHLWKALAFANPLMLSRGDYTLELSHSGYTHSDTSYLGWVKPHENIFNETDGFNSNIALNPLGFRLIENKRCNYD